MLDVGRGLLQPLLDDGSVTLCCGLWGWCSGLRFSGRCFGGRCLGGGLWWGCCLGGRGLGGGFRERLDQHLQTLGLLCRWHGGDACHLLHDLCGHLWRCGLQDASQCLQCGHGVWVVLVPTCKFIEQSRWVSGCSATLCRRGTSRSRGSLFLRLSELCKKAIWIERFW